MNMTHTETLSAMVDGEAVDVVQLAEALEDAEARRALVDFVRMREAARADGAQMPATLGQLRRSTSIRRVLRWTVAAAVLLLVFVVGLITPLPGRKDATAGGDVPPQPARVERFEPGVDWHSGD